MGIFKKKEERDSENLPTTIFLNPGLKVLEGLRSEKIIGKNLEAMVKIKAQDSDLQGLLLKYN